MTKWFRFKMVPAGIRGAKLAKAVLSTKEELDQIPENLRELYVEKEGKWYLDVENIEEMPQVGGLKSALQKEREARDKAIRDQKDLIKKFEGVDPEQAREAMKKLHDLEDQKLIDAGKIEEVVAQRTERLKADHQQQVTKFQQELTDRDKQIIEGKNRLARLMVEAGITRAVTSKAGQVLGIVPQALADIARRALEVFQMDEKTQQMIPRKADGSIIYGKDPTQPMTMEEWLPTLKSDCPHYFKESSGSGGGNDAGGGVPKKERSKMTPAEKAQFIGKYGQDAYLNLPG